MNKPNPLVPQGTFADKGRSHVRITVFAILAVHLVLLGVLLIAGCNKGGTDTTDPNTIVPPPPPPPPPTLDVPPPTNPPGAGLTGGTPAHGGPGAVPPPTIITETPPPPPPPPPAAPDANEHTIVQGDSFYTLGKKYNVGYKAIADANPGVDSTKLKIGQKVKIPASKTGPGLTAGGPVDGGASAPTGEVIHTVKSGDNLWTLSRTYGVKESAIRSANNLKTAQLKVGQKLKIPSKTAAPPLGTPPPVDHGAVPAAPPPAGGGLLLEPR